MFAWKKVVIRFETISSTKNIEREIKIRATLEIFQLAIPLGVYQTFESWLTRIYLILAVERLKNKYIYIYKRKFFVQTRMTRFSKRPEIIYRVEACCESIHPWYRFHGRSGNGRLKQTTREMQFVHLSRCRKKLAARVNEHSSEYLAAACIHRRRNRADFGAGVRNDDSARSIRLSRSESAQIRSFQTCVIFTRKYKFWQTNGCSRAILYALIWSATCACCAASLVSPSRVNIKKDQGTLIDAYPLSTFIARNRRVRRFHLSSVKIQME